MKPFIYSIIIPVCMFMQTGAFGQVSESGIYSSHKYAVKFSPFALLPLPLSALQVGFEHKLKNERHALQHEVAAVFPFPYHVLNTDFQGMNGFRAVSGYRYYINEPTSRFNFFTSTQYRLQYESWNLRHWFDRHGGSFRQLFDYRKRVMSHGLSASIGGNKKARHSRFIFEWEIGLGAKSRTVFNKGIPSDATSRNDFILLFGDQFNPTESQTAGTKILPVVLASIKFGFVIP